MGKPVRNGKELRDLILWAKEQGFTCEVTNRSHLCFRRPDTKSVFASYTPSCQFGREHARRDLKKALNESEQRQREPA